MMASRDTISDAVTPQDQQRAALTLLKAGLCNLSEAAELAGLSRQLLHHHARKIDWQRARQRWLAAQWQRLVRRRVARRQRLAHGKTKRASKK